MAKSGSRRIPAACGWIVRLAACLVPWHARDAWRKRWRRSAESWWMLVDRGEVIPRGVAGISGEIVGDAWHEGFGRLPVRLWMRSPLFPVACAVIAILLLAAVTGGLPATSRLVLTAAGHVSGPARDLLYAHLFTLAFASITAIFVIVIRRLGVAGSGGRGWGLLAMKLATVPVFVTLLWIEGGAVLRWAIPVQGIRVLVGGPLLAFVFVGAFGWAVAWCLMDQRRRCPVCLRRLTMPVTVGSWGSVFDAPTTEVLCDIGHGRMCICDAEAGEPGRWQPLDESWSELFA